MAGFAAGVRFMPKIGEDTVHALVSAVGETKTASQSGRRLLTR